MTTATVGTTSEPTDERELSLVGKTITVIVVVGLLMLALSGAIWGLTHAGAYKAMPVYTSDYMKEMGFDPSSSHPLQLGAAIQGSSGQITGKSSVALIFGSGYSRGSFQGQTQPASAVRLGLTVGRESYILELPYSKVRFVQDASAPASALFSINNTLDGHRHMAVDWSCETLVLPACYHPARVQTTARDTAQWHNLSKSGIGALLSSHVVSVRLTLSPAQYEQYLNG